MPLTRQGCRSSLSQLRLPIAVRSIFDGHSPHPSLANRCRDPYYIFSAPVEPPGGRITPLWECGCVVTAYQHSSLGRFITFSLEAPGEVTVLGSSFATVTAASLISLWEDEVPDKALCEIAALFEFHQIDRLLSECHFRPRSETPADYYDWHNRFLQSCENVAWNRDRSA